MILGVFSEVLLVAGYAAFLVLVAAGLEALGRHSYRRSELFHVTGFQYRRELDLWECPTGHQLPRSETDYRRRIVRYRAPSHVCNSCPAKPACTDSDKGREIERHVGFMAQFGNPAVPSRGIRGTAAARRTDSRGADATSPSRP